MIGINFGGVVQVRVLYILFYLYLYCVELGCYNSIFIFFYEVNCFLFQDFIFFCDVVVLWVNFGLDLKDMFFKVSFFWIFQRGLICYVFCR